jgi:hypothetical protein
MKHLPYIKKSDTRLPVYLGGLFRSESNSAAFFLAPDWLKGSGVTEAQSQVGVPYNTQSILDCSVGSYIT